MTVFMNRQEIIMIRKIVRLIIYQINQFKKSLASTTQIIMMKRKRSKTTSTRPNKCIVRSKRHRLLRHRKCQRSRNQSRSKLFWRIVREGILEIATVLDNRILMIQRNILWIINRTMLQSIDRRFHDCILFYNTCQ